MNESPVLPLDLFGHPLPRVRARPVLAEGAAMVEVMRALRAHPAVAWVERMNSGATKLGKRIVRFGFPGCPDVLGQLHDSRLLAVEVKGPRGRLRPEQKVVLARVADARGVSFVARSLCDVVAALGPLDGVRGQTRADRVPCVDVGVLTAPRCGA
jgi:hypothetical protein